MPTCERDRGGEEEVNRKRAVSASSERMKNRECDAIRTARA
jgi:hypothetical protein